MGRFVARSGDPEGISGSNQVQDGLTTAFIGVNSTPCSMYDAAKLHKVAHESQSESS